MPFEATRAPRLEWRCMRRLTLLTALSLVLAACDGGASGGATGGVGGKAVGGAAGGGASGKAGAGGGAKWPRRRGHGRDGRWRRGRRRCLGSVATAAARWRRRQRGRCGSAAGNGGSAGGSGGSGGGAAGAGGVSVGGAAGGGASGASGAAGLGGAAGPQPLDGGGTMQAVPLSTNDLVFDSTRRVLYASTNSTANGVVTVEPASGTVTQALPVGGLPSVLLPSAMIAAPSTSVSAHPQRPPRRTRCAASTLHR